MKTLVIILITLFLLQNSYCQKVYNKQELKLAIENAKPGTSVILANGIWQDTQIDIKKIGTLKKPIIIKGENAGQVFLEGNSYFHISGEYIYLKDLVFQNALNINPENNVIRFNITDDDACNNCKVKNIKIDSYNADSTQQTEIFKWILLSGTNNEVAYSSFIGKYGKGSIINDIRKKSKKNITQVFQ